MHDTAVCLVILLKLQNAELQSSVQLSQSSSHSPHQGLTLRRIDLANQPPVTLYVKASFMYMHSKVVLAK